MELLSKDNSPNKQLDDNKTDLMMMLQECSKNIEKLEFRSINKKTS